MIFLIFACQAENRLFEPTAGAFFLFEQNAGESTCGQLPVYVTLTVLVPPWPHTRVSLFWRPFSRAVKGHLTESYTISANRMLLLKTG